MGNVGDNNVSSYRLHASETEQLSYVPMADATRSVICVELLGGDRQPMTGRLATHPNNTTADIDGNRLWNADLCISVRNIFPQLVNDIT